MNILSRVGSQNNSIEYRDRPTVKVIISKGRDVLILNNGLLPGGGIEPDETDFQAIERELAEAAGRTRGPAYGWLAYYRCGARACRSVNSALRQHRNCRRLATRQAA